MQLSEFQNNFKDLMLDHPDALEDLNPDLADQFQKNGIALPKRLAVYRNNIVGSLTDVMLDSFPTLKALVGEEFLTQMGRSFILEHPPSHGCLNFYGTGFDQYIENFPPAQELPYLADIARLEIALNDSYYAKDEGALTPQSLGNIPEAELSTLPLILMDHVKLIQSLYPLDEIYNFCNTENPDGELDLNAGGVKLMIFRADLETHLKTLSDSEFHFLSLCEKQAALSDAIAETVNTYPDFDFGAFLQTFLPLETFLNMDTNRTP